MMNEINWKLDLQVKDGPKFNLSDLMKVEVYNRLDLDIPEQGYLDVIIDSGSLSDVQFLLIQRTDKPDQPPAGQPARRLMYTVNNSDRCVFLENQHLLLGQGVMNLLSEAPQRLHFKNEQAKPAHVAILIGRKVPARPTDESKLGDEFRNWKGGCADDAAGSSGEIIGEKGAQPTDGTRARNGDGGNGDGGNSDPAPKASETTAAGA
jgi:hypothetical protein